MVEMENTRSVFLPTIGSQGMENHCMSGASASATATSHPQARQENRAVALVSLVQVLFETLCDSKASPVARYGSKIHPPKNKKTTI